MPNMILDGYTFANNPTNFNDILGPKQDIAYHGTYSAVAIFSFPETYVGQPIILDFNVMSITMFDLLRTKRSAGTIVQFDPQDGYGIIYWVKIIDVTGKYHVHMGPSGTLKRARKNCQLHMVVTGVV